MSAWGACDGSKAILPVVQACGHLGEGSELYEVVFNLLRGAVVSTFLKFRVLGKNDHVSMV